MIFRPLFRYHHKKSVQKLRIGVDDTMQQERDNPDEFAAVGMLLPVVLAGLREKSKRPIDVFLRPTDLTWSQRKDMLLAIQNEAEHMLGVLAQNPSDKAAYYACSCLDWLNLLHAAYFRAADMPDVLPELTVQVRDDISDLIFRALDAGSSTLENLPSGVEQSETLH